MATNKQTQQKMADYFRISGTAISAYEPTGSYVASDAVLITDDDTLSIYAMVDPAAAGTTDMTLLFELEDPTTGNWHAVGWAVSPDPTTLALQTDKGLKYTYSGVAAQYLPNFELPSSHDVNVRVKVKNSGGAGDAVTLTWVRGRGGS